MLKFDEIYELDNGDWRLDYTGPGGDYSVIIAGPDAEVRIKEYALYLGFTPDEVEV